MSTSSSKKRTRDSSSTIIGSSKSSSESGLVGVPVFLNMLPDIPFSSKMLDYKLDPERFIRYKTTTVEQRYRYELHHNADLDLNIDMVNSLGWESPWTQLDYMQPPSKMKKLNEPILPFADYLKRNAAAIRSILNDAKQNGVIVAGDSTLSYEDQISIIPKNELSMLYNTKFLSESTQLKLPETFNAVSFLKRTEYISTRRDPSRDTKNLVEEDNLDIESFINAGKSVNNNNELEDDSVENKELFLKVGAIDSVVDKIQQSFKLIESRESIVHPLGKTDVHIVQEWDVLPDDSIPESYLIVIQPETLEPNISALISQTINAAKEDNGAFGPILLPIEDSKTKSILDSKISNTFYNPLVQPISILLPHTSSLSNSTENLNSKRTVSKSFRAESVTLDPSFETNGACCFIFGQTSEYDVDSDELDNETGPHLKKRQDLRNAKVGIATYLPLHAQINLKKVTQKERNLLAKIKGNNYALIRDLE